jgi:hypothetical protein
MRVTFLTPGAGLVALAVLLPLLAFVRTERRAERVRSLLRLAAPGGSPGLTAGALVAVALLAGLAAAQPVLEDWDDTPERVDAQVILVFDTSRSMLASRTAGAPSRFDRAAAAARRLRMALEDVPVGIASMTDRVLPHLLPTSNEESFESVLRYSIGVDRPPSDRAENQQSTDLGATRFLAEGNYFRGSEQRVLVIFTDGETNRYDVRRLAAAFSDSGIQAMIVRFWADGERIFGPDGIEEVYSPDADSLGNTQRFAQIVRGRAFEESQVPALVQAVRSSLGSGTSVQRVKTVDIQPLGPFVLLAALLPLSYLLVRRNLSPV